MMKALLRKRKLFPVGAGVVPGKSRRIGQLDVNLTEQKDLTAGGHVWLSLSDIGASQSYDVSGWIDGFDGGWSHCVLWFRRNTDPG